MRARYRLGGGGHARVPLDPPVRDLDRDARNPQVTGGKTLGTLDGQPVGHPGPPEQRAQVHPDPGQMDDQGQVVEVEHDPEEGRCEDEHRQSPRQEPAVTAGGSRGSRIHGQPQGGRTPVPCLTDRDVGPFGVRRAIGDGQSRNVQGGHHIGGNDEVSASGHRRLPLRSRNRTDPAGPHRCRSKAVGRRCSGLRRRACLP